MEPASAHLLCPTNPTSLPPDPLIPARIAYDHTSSGPVWDPVLSAYFYTVDSAENPTPDAASQLNYTYVFHPRAAGGDPPPTAYLDFLGHWGDKRYPDDDRRQFNFHGIVRFDDGPTGPMFKGLARDGVCRTVNETTGECDVRSKIT